MCVCVLCISLASVPATYDMVSKEAISCVFLSEAISSSIQSIILQYLHIVLVELLKLFPIVFCVSVCK